ncbi:hypothetical protein Tco_0903979 [Tanacetum coccineum]
MGSSINYQKIVEKEVNDNAMGHLVDGLIRLMGGENTGPINIGNRGEITMIEFAEIVKEVAPAKLEALLLSHSEILDAAIQVIQGDVRITAIEGWGNVYKFFLYSLPNMDI